MKNLLVLISLGLLCSFTNPVPNMTAINKSMNEGDATALSNFFDNSIEISIQDKEDMLEKAEALKTMQGFFGKNKPKSYSQVHQGTSKSNNGQYTIGSLVTTGGTFRVYLYLKVVSDKYIIQEMRIDKE
jgi:Domain of unknown function (DUF4783)